MAKRGGKLTRADKIRLSEEQKQAAGIDPSKPSHYAQKIAAENGVEDERLGDSFKTPIPQTGSASHNIGEHGKTLKPRFSAADLRRPARAPRADSSSPEEYAAQRMKYFDLDDEGRFTLK